MLNVTHYDRPVSHSNTQTRWVLPAGRKIFAKSMKVLDLQLTTNTPCYFAPLVGSFGCVKRLQVRVASKEVDQWYAQPALPYLLSLQDNEHQRGINKVLFGMGNNTVYDFETKLLTLDRPEVSSQTVQIPLTAFSDFLNTVQCLEESVEIIITWETKLSKFLCPLEVGGAAPTSLTIQAPFLSYETINYDVQQPKEFLFKKQILEEMVIPDSNIQPPMAGFSQEVSVRSNSLTGKLVGRILLSNQPSSISLGTPNADLSDVYDVFGGYFSPPMAQQVWNLALDGQNILTFKNVNNDATQLAITSMAFGNGHFVTGSHIHREQSALKELELSGSALNGFASYGGVELNQKIDKDIVLTFKRYVDPSYPSLNEQLLVQMVGEVQCVYRGAGVVEYF